jgi:dTDP-4-dehydrorhamnose reductase
MRIFISGITGQLGQALHKCLSEQGVTILETPRWDISDHTIVQKLNDLRPDMVIHTAAMTNVDGAAQDPDTAFKVNAFGTQNIAHACLRSNAEMVYVSSNEIFSGDASEPYREDDKPVPINPYGSSKRSGEQMAAHYMRDGLYIVRTAWLYAPGGNNFPAKIIATADKHKELRVVADEISNPTYVPDLAEAIAQLIHTRAYGIYHLTNSGYCSRYDFAQEILRLSGRETIPIQPITLADYSRPSTVPPFTPLANINGKALGLELRPWQEGLQAYFENSRFILDNLTGE